MKVFADYHTHTCYSHGKGTIEDNVKAAIDRGLTEIGISDHGPSSYSFHKLGVQNSEELLDIKAEAHRLQYEYPEIKIYAGVEANIVGLDGTIDVSERVLEKLDKVLVGLHLMVVPKSFEDGGRLLYDNIIRYKINKNSREKIRYNNTLALINAIQRYPIDIITHPGYRLDIDTAELAKACSKLGVALEINVSHGFLSEEFVKIAAKEGVNFVISSDAHCPEEVGRVKVGIDLVKKLNLPTEQILNLQ